jgi:two-component system response regulator FixJ
MPSMSGPDLQEQLARRGIDTPVIIITGHGDVATAVRVVRSGALDVLEKPFSDQLLLDRINQAIVQDAERRRLREEQAEAAARLARLTPRERETMDLLVAGKSAKQIALELGLSVTTVNLHRSHAMDKLEATSLIDLVRLAETKAGSAPGPAA